MRTSILFLVLVVVGLLPSCHVYESVDTELYQRPTLEVSYQYVNDSSQNTLLQEVQVLDVWVQDNAGATVLQQQILQEHMQHYRPLYGAMEGEYEVVSWGNLDRCVISADSVFIPVGSSSSDPLFFHRGVYQVFRGTPLLNTAQLYKLYYVIDLQVLGMLSSAESSVGDCRVEFSGTPMGFTFGGKAFGSGSIVPILRENGDIIVSGFNIPRFTSTNSIMLTISHQGNILGQFSLSSLLADGSSGLDFLNSKDVVIPLVVDVTTAGVTLTINGWEAAVVQFENVGG